MTLDSVINSLSNGIFLGSLYSLAGIGFALIFGVMRYFNVAHGYLLVVGGYVAYYMFTIFNFDPLLSVPLAMMALFLLGMLLYQLLFGHLAKFPEKSRITNSMLISFGLGLVVQNLAILFFTANERTIQTSYSGAVLEVLGTRLSVVGLISLGLAVVMVVALGLVLSKTYFGMSIRAVSQDFETAAAMGINVKRTYLISFAIGLALAAVAGTALAMGLAISPVMGQSWTNKAVVVVMLAGMGQINGVFFAGILLGVVEAISVYFTGPAYQEVVGLVLLVIILIVKPGGLFMKKAGVT
jgi:branched-chain amino acid transport system permease protein